MMLIVWHKTTAMIISLEHNEVMHCMILLLDAGSFEKTKDFFLLTVLECENVHTT